MLTNNDVDDLGLRLATDAAFSLQNRNDQVILGHQIVLGYKRREPPTQVCFVLQHTRLDSATEKSTSIMQHDFSILIVETHIQQNKN